MTFDEAMAEARSGAAITRSAAKFYLKLFADGFCIGRFDSDEPLKRLHFLHNASLSANDWKVMNND